MTDQEIADIKALSGREEKKKNGV
jgi:hypothetical protein